MRFSKYRKGAFLGIAFGLALTATSVASALTADNLHEPSEPIAPPLNASKKELAKYKEEYVKWAEKNNKITYFTPEKTKGSKINVNGKEVQLPEDAYVDGLLVSYHGKDVNEVLELPGLIIVRGDSDIVVNPDTGKVLKRNLQSKPTIKSNAAVSDPFDFLNGVIIENNLNGK